MKRLFALATALMAGLIGVAAQAGDDPDSVFKEVPTPVQPVSVYIKDGEARFKSEAYDAISRKVLSGAKATNTVGSQQMLDDMGSGIDAQRMQSDPAYAAHMQAKFAQMSPSEAMAMAQRMQNAQQTRFAQGGRGQENVASFIAENQATDLSTRKNIHSILTKALKDADALHAKVDKAMGSAIKHCAKDKTGWPKASCYNPFLAEGLKEHRDAEKEASAAEIVAFRKAELLALGQVKKMAPMLVTARQSGDGGSVAALTADIDVYTTLLNDYGRAVSVRTDFWQQEVSGNYVGRPVYFMVVNGKRMIDWPLLHPGKYQP